MKRFPLSYSIKNISALIKNETVFLLVILLKNITLPRVESVSYLLLSFSYFTFPSLSHKTTLNKIRAANISIKSTIYLW